ncbi:hypothetical protein TUZN_1882 [Thermoproteus uzoniensis 768-20]|uniref:Uncharacterized protein n=1 Tax=Thermoproteus uzoniensis (strain 768-20) TaxID=999630 RepID=F2L4B0_THEU7|nr:hypothetical protein [Thermoproteus uzoniensis]AEA13342.1 hypothetical protein TUZN_1882 [Thermoproteus uzoniensis 768-20]
MRLWLVAAVAVAVVAAVVVLLLFFSRPSGPPVSYVAVEAPYVFLLPRGGVYELGYYDTQGNWHGLGTYNASSTALKNAVSTIEQFNQRYTGTTLPQPYGTQFQPLAYVVVIGNTTGTVKIPIEGNTILLDRVNPGDWTILVTDPKDVNKLMYALDTGYKESAYANPMSSIWISQYPGSIFYEIKSLQSYNNEFVGSYVIVMNNNTLIPWGYEAGNGYSLLFVQQKEGNFYS